VDELREVADLIGDRHHAPVEPKLMKIIIAGSRDVTSYEAVAAAVQHSTWAPTEVVSGCARGVDSLGESWARNHGVAVKDFPANWAEHGVRAGPLRNLDMAEYADALIAVWNGRSAGTRHMIESMHRRGKPVFIYRVAV
jgi:YspA, cpYpsA-related SLOG family